jgi:hypothetical protein
MLLGIANDSERLGIAPDYTATVAKVYLDTALCILRAYPHLDLLSSIFTEKSIRLPLWVPDWSLAPKPATGTLLLHTSLLRRGLHRTSAERLPYIRYDPASNRLTLDGLLVDRISYTTGAIAYRANPNSTLENFVWFENQLGRAQDLPMYSSGDGGIDAFWRSLITNVTHDHQITTSRYQAPVHGFQDAMGYADCNRFRDTGILNAQAGVRASSTLSQGNYRKGHLAISMHNTKGLPVLGSKGCSDQRLCM